MKKIKKMFISVAISIMLLHEKVAARASLYGPPEVLNRSTNIIDKSTFIESVWKIVKTYILPISLFFIAFIIGSIIFFKKSKRTIKEKITTLILIFFSIVILVSIGLVRYYVMIPEKIVIAIDSSEPGEFVELYDSPEVVNEPTFTESIWKMVKTYILPISLFFIIFIVGSIIFFKKSKGTTKEKIITLILIFFMIVILIAIGWGIYYVMTNII